MIPSTPQAGWSPGATAGQVSQGPAGGSDPAHHPVLLAQRGLVDGGNEPVLEIIRRVPVTNPLSCAQRWAVLPPRRPTVKAECPSPSKQTWVRVPVSTARTAVGSVNGLHSVCCGSGATYHACLSRDVARRRTRGRCYRHLWGGEARGATNRPRGRTPTSVSAGPLVRDPSSRQALHKRQWLSGP